MRVEFIREPNWSIHKCLKLIAESPKDEAELAAFFNEGLKTGDIDYFTDGEETNNGFKDLTLYKKI